MALTCTYGCHRHRRDVSALVRQHWVRDNVLVLPRGTVLNDVLGDPTPNRRKQLVVVHASAERPPLVRWFDEHVAADTDVTVRFDTVAPLAPCALHRFPLLFHKLILGVPAPALHYRITAAARPHAPGTPCAHLHCFALDRLSRHFPAAVRAQLTARYRVVLTYHVGDPALVPPEWVALRLTHNQGMDIGGKFAAVHYLRHQASYTHMLLLHGKTDDSARRTYTEPLLRDVRELRQLDANTVYFAQALHRVPGTSTFNVAADWARNAHYVRELHGYLGMHATTRSQDFVEGNVGIVTRAVAERLYGDAAVFRALNTPASIDCNWARLYHRLPAEWTHEQVLTHCRAAALAPNNLSLRYTRPDEQQLRDGMLEHAFERTTLAVARLLAHHVCWLS